MCQDCGCSVHTSQKVLEVQRKVLEQNDLEAGHNREMLGSCRVLGVNLMSSPGSGKTTLLERTIDLLKGELRIGVIEGDLETDRDAERIRIKGVHVHQITTGQTCHLDAVMVHSAMHELPVQEMDILFVENVGNLVCPATYDIGTHINVVLLSTTEGDDKPAKYPVIFRNSDLMLITKTDYLPYTDFNTELAAESARAINPRIRVIKLSSRTGDGILEWLDFLRGQLNLIR